MRFSGWILDVAHRHLLSNDGAVVPITGAEFRILSIFLERPNQVLHRDFLMNLLCGRDATPYDRSIDLKISRLRKKLDSNASGVSMIKTVRCEGYVLAAHVGVE